MKSLMEHLHQPENRAEFNSADLLRLLQPALGSQNISFPSNIHQRVNIESPSVMDISLDNGVTDESIPLTFGTSEEDEDVGEMQNADLAHANFFDGYVQTEYGQTSNSHNEHPILMNRPAETTDSGTAENKFNGSPVAPEKPEPLPVRKAPRRPMAPPVRPASVKSYGKDEEPRFEKVKKETAVINIKPECISLFEIFPEKAPRDLFSFRREMKLVEEKIQYVEKDEEEEVEVSSGDEEENDGVESGDEEEDGGNDDDDNDDDDDDDDEEAEDEEELGTEYLVRPVGRPEDEEDASDFGPEENGEEEDVEEENEDEDEDNAGGKVKAPPKRKRSDINNARTNAALQAQPNTTETAARAKVLEYKEHGSAGNSSQKKKSKEIEHARGKSNSVAAPTGTTSESTKSSTDPPPPNLLNVFVGIFLLLAITCQALDF